MNGVFCCVEKLGLTGRHWVWYSIVQNVTDHMQKYGIKKPSVQKALDTLQEKELIVGIVRSPPLTPFY